MNDPLSVERRAAAQKADRTLRALCRDLAAGELRLDDFDPGTVAELREILADIEPQPDSFAYAGVGSRRTPPEVLAAMADIAQTLGDAGTALSTGGADGADKAFETGALRTDAPITVHTPWPGYNGYRPGRDPEKDIDVVHPKSTAILEGRAYAELAREHHPYWNRCGRGARALFVRNVSILAGALDGEGGTLPVRAVIAYTPNGLPVGREAGGAGHTLRTAASLDVPCVNLSRRTPPERNAAPLAAGILVRRHARHPGGIEAVPPDRRSPPRWIPRAWASASPLEGTPAERYLRSRGLLPPWSGHLRWDRRRRRMLARVTLGTDLRGLHATSVPGRERRTHGPVRGAAVRLAAMDGGVLALAEGIETALAYAALTGTPAWAALSSAGMKHVELPDGLRWLAVAADFDGPGLSAAEQLERRARDAGIEARIDLPSRHRTDWADVLAAAATPSRRRL